MSKSRSGFLPWLALGLKETASIFTLAKMAADSISKYLSMKIQNVWIPLLIYWLTFFAGCRAPEQLREQAKAQRLLERIEKLDRQALTYSTDTVYRYIAINDTFFVESRTYDTSFFYLPGDTVTLTDTVSNIVTKIVFREGSASLSLHIPKDTLIVYDTIQVPVAINHSIEIEKKWLPGALLWLRKGINWLLALAGLIGLLAVSLFLRKKIYTGP